MLISYRPENENPPREAGISLGLLNEKTKQYDTLRLVPGLNRDVDPELWSRAKQLKEITNRLAMKVIEEITELEEIPDTSTTEITTLSVDKVQQVVELTHDLNLLDKWFEADKRVRVRNAIQRRIIEIKSGRA